VFCRTNYKILLLLLFYLAFRTPPKRLSTLMSKDWLLKRVTSLRLHWSNGLCSSHNPDNSTIYRKSGNSHLLLKTDAVVQSSITTDQLISIWKDNQIQFYQIASLCSSMTNKSSLTKKTSSALRNLSKNTLTKPTDAWSLQSRNSMDLWILARTETTKLCCLSC